MNTILAYVTATVMAVSVLTGLWAYSERTRRVAAEERYERTKTDLAVLRKAHRKEQEARFRAEKRAKDIRLGQAEAQKRLEAALAASAVQWAQQEVPEAVREALK